MKSANKKLFFLSRLSESETFLFASKSFAFRMPKKASHNFELTSPTSLLSFLISLVSLSNMLRFWAQQKQQSSSAWTISWIKIYLSSDFPPTKHQHKQELFLLCKLFLFCWRKETAAATKTLPKIEIEICEKRKEFLKFLMFRFNGNLFLGGLRFTWKIFSLERCSAVETQSRLVSCRFKRKIEKTLKKRILWVDENNTERRSLLRLNSTRLTSFLVIFPINFIGKFNWNFFLEAQKIPKRISQRQLACGAAMLLLNELHASENYVNLIFETVSCSPAIRIRSVVDSTSLSFE